MNKDSNPPKTVEAVTPSETNAVVTTPDSGPRYPRSADSPNLSTERVMTCSPWMGDTAAYWKYEYEVPASCYSKLISPYID